MQYTNFLRDIQEDWIKYGRIYIPADELKKYGITYKDLITYCEKTQQPTNNRKQCIKDQIIKTKHLYREAEKHIS